MKLKTRQEIAQSYGITRRTLYRKLKAAGVVLNTGLVGMADQEKVFAVLGRSNDEKITNHFDNISEKRSGLVV